MSEIDEGRLTLIGSKFLRVIKDRWPEFLNFASLQVDNELVIEYPSPHSANAPVLWISADVHLDEMIVGLAGPHSNGGPWNDPSELDYEFRSTIKFIEAILREEVVACMWRTGGAIGQLEYLKSQAYWKDVQSIRSWRGSFDAN